MVDGGNGVSLLDGLEVGVAVCITIVLLLHHLQSHAFLLVCLLLDLLLLSVLDVIFLIYFSNYLGLDGAICLHCGCDVTLHGGLLAHALK